jgi:hypothetical protein
MSQGAGIRSAAEAASDVLHARVRELARKALSGLEAAARACGGALLEPSAADGFDELALDIARFQVEHNPAFARLCRQRGARLTRLELVPAVPADAFRLGRVAAHPECSDVARFLTSGTTGGSGRHVFRTLDTYAELSVRWGRLALLGGGTGRCTVLALASPFEPERRSSLGYMMQRFMQELDGRPLGRASAFDAFGACGAVDAFDADEPGRWLLGGTSVDVPGLRRGARLAEQRGEPLLLLATSFALVWLLDTLAGERLPLPPGSVILWTGGFKGRSRSVEAADLGRALCQTFALPQRQLIGEYGMTELSSQLYDRGFNPGSPHPSVFVEPPWLRVTPVDPISLEPVAPREVGLARFTDLCNVDSALNVLTQDRVRRVPGGIVLAGRQASARLRGCSLAVEALAAAASSASPEAGRGAGAL